MTTEILKLDVIDSPIGKLHLNFSDAALHAVSIVNETAISPESVHSNEQYSQRSAFQRYFAGDLEALTDLTIEMHGTPFQQSVWQQLRRIPPGKTISYAELAKRIGNSKAVRAVGSANGRNPLCIIVPCHRVISADGSLGGFSAGLDAKRWLLNHEGAAFKA